MSIDSILRCSVRIDLTVSDRPLAVVDLALPAGSSLADILEEVLRLAGAPQISRPWVGRTAAGSPVDATVPLSQTSLDQGGVLVLSPERDLPAPIVHDPAEALAEIQGTSPPRGLIDAASLAGLATLTLIALSVNPGLHHATILAAAALVALAVLVWKRDHTPLVLASVFLGACAGGTSVTGSIEGWVHTWSSVDTTTLAWCLGAASASGLIALLILRVIIHPPPRPMVVSAVIFLLMGVSALAYAFRTLRSTEDHSGPAALTVAVALIVIACSPRIAANLSGIRVPTMPSAGQDLSISDTDLPDAEGKAQQGAMLLDALVLGTVFIVVPALPTVASRADGFGFAFCCSVAVATLLHAVRHRSALATWSLTIICLSALVAAGIIAASGSVHWSLVVIGGTCGAACLASPLWVAKVPECEPTTLVWFERAESLAVAATLPLAVHLMGVFGMLRGLSIL